MVIVYYRLFLQPGQHKMFVCSVCSYFLTCCSTIIAQRCDTRRPKMYKFTMNDILKIKISAKDLHQGKGFGFSWLSKQKTTRERRGGGRKGKKNVINSTTHSEEALRSREEIKEGDEGEGRGVNQCWRLTRKNNQLRKRKKKHVMKASSHFNDYLSPAATVWTFSLSVYGVFLPGWSCQQGCDCSA